MNDKTPPLRGATLTREEQIEAIARIIAPGAWEEEAVKWHWEMWARDLQFAAKEKAHLIMEYLGK